MVVSRRPSRRSSSITRSVAFAADIKDEKGQVLTARIVLDSRRAAGGFNVRYDRCEYQVEWIVAPKVAADNLKVEPSTETQIGGEVRLSNGCSFRNVRPQLKRTRDPAETCGSKRCCTICPNPCSRSFAQQLSRYNQFYMTPPCLAVSYFILGTILFVMGGIFASDSATVVETSVMLYEAGDANEPVEFTWNGPEDKDVFIYYYVQSFYQSHYHFVRNGKYENIVYKNTGVQYDTQFTDTFELDGGAVKIHTDKIAYPADIDYLLNNSAPSQTGLARDNGKFAKAYNTSSKYCTSWGKCNCTTESCLTWVKGATGPEFFKLYGRINAKDGLKRGEHVMSMPNNDWDIAQYEGKKGFFLSTTGAYGGKKGSAFAGTFSFALGTVIIVFAIIQSCIYFFTKRDTTLFLQKLMNVEERLTIVTNIPTFETDIQKVCCSSRKRRAASDSVTAERQGKKFEDI